MNKEEFITIFILCLLVAGCVTGGSRLTFINYSDSVYPAHAKDFPIEFYFDYSRPLKKYVVIGEICGHVSDSSKVRDVLMAKARQVGGDALIEIKISFDTRTTTQKFEHEYTITKRQSSTLVKTSSIPLYSVSAKVVKYLDEQPLSFLFDANYNAH